MKALWQRWQAQRETRLLQTRAIPDALWNLTLARLPFLARRSDPDRAELRREYPELDDEDIRQALVFAASSLDGRIAFVKGSS